MSLIAGGVILAAAAADRLFAEPPRRLHPVALLGRLIAPLDRPWRYPRVVGAAGAVAIPLSAALLAGGGVRVATAIHPAAGAALAAFVLFSTTSRRLLCTTAEECIALSASDLPHAREELLALAGRKAGSLSAGEVRSAAVESAAENLSDGLLAPLFGFGVAALLAGSRLDPPAALAVATAAAAWIKAVNTMDSMLGYRSKPVGTASARLDDLVMWLPARLTALLLAAAALRPDSVGRARRWAGEPPSPNAGWPMATLAAALSVRLEKPGSYVLNPIASLPTVAEGTAGVAVVRRAGWLAFGTTAVIVSV